MERLDNAETHFKQALNYLKLSKNCKVKREQMHRSRNGADSNFQNE
jgi:hypothetical protein